MNILHFLLVLIAWYFGIGFLIALGALMSEMSNGSETDSFYKSFERDFNPKEFGKTIICAPLAAFFIACDIAIGEIRHWRKIRSWEKQGIIQKPKR